jgi:hypothetical protein
MIYIILLLVGILVGVMLRWWQLGLLTMAAHSQPTHPGHRPLGFPVILKTRRRLLSMNHHRLCVSVDLWWWSFWISIDWSTYV